MHDEVVRPGAADAARLPGRADRAEQELPQVVEALPLHLGQLGSGRVPLPGTHLDPRLQQPLPQEPQKDVAQPSLHIGTEPEDGEKESRLLLCFRSAPTRSDGGSRNSDEQMLSTLGYKRSSFSPT
ncbi:hypothetical protein [Actinacidiphila oryziradicis]|uniref:Uncharacterized protein n=1 Tax=Actinacidiphila oryziradicis TaxID=2571141 RepID=A0A4U0S970_9ACTN|nr:hypothetical protein [Actinacidiphila oryziradicis]TKA04787.1 hypothetical protein FCI23_34630 [Actinacidiphila oryziradicis]